MPLWQAPYPHCPRKRDDGAFAGTIGTGELLFIEDIVAVGIGFIEEVGEDDHLGGRNLLLAGKGGRSDRGKAKTEEEDGFHSAFINVPSGDSCQSTSPIDKASCPMSFG